MAAIDELLPAGLGSAARQSRSSGWKSWVSFAEPLGIHLADFSDHNRALWQAHMYLHPGHSYKPGTLKTYASAIRSVITESGFPQPPCAGPMSLQFSRAVASLRPSRRARKPITIPMLAKLKPHFNFTKQMDRSVWAITTVGVHAVCRLGELAPSTYAEPFYPRREDYRLLDQDGIHASEILIHRSKMDKLFKGVWVTVPHNGIATSAHEALLDAFASKAPGRIRTMDEHPLFPDSFNRPVLKAYVIKRLREILPLEGYDPEEFSGHSIRIGGCQSLFDVEVDLRNIACAGRWVKGSQAIRLYRTVTLEARSEWARRATAPPAAPRILDLKELKAAAKQAACSAGDDESQTESGDSSSDVSE